MKSLLLCLTVLALTACGFQLRGAYSFSFATANIESNAKEAEFARQLQRALESDGKVKITEPKSAPQARIRILEVFSDKRILSLSSGGKVREFLLEQRVKFDVIDMYDRTLLPETVINAARDFSYADAQVLAKEGEERMLRIDMQTDLVAQMMRQLQAAQLNRTEGSK